MERWHYDLATDPGPTKRDSPPVGWREPGLLIRSVRSAAAVVLRCWLRLYHRLTIVGRQNLPRDRSFILIANHTSHLDTLCLLAALPLGRLRCAFPVAATDYFCVGALRTLFARVVVNALPFDRQFAPWDGLRLCAQLLQRPGTILVLFPEGTRSDSGEPAKFKPGVALLAAGHDIPVVPCHLAGARAALPKGAWCPRPRAVRLTIGAPRSYAEWPATKESAAQICRELREDVMALGVPAPADDWALHHEPSIL